MRKLAVRASAVKSWLTGSFPFKGMVYLLIPGRWRPRLKGDVVTVFGHPFYVDYGDLAQFYDTYHQIVIMDSYQKHLIKDGHIVVDAGANIGIFSVLIAHEYPHAIVHAFEPTPYTFEILKKNTRYYPNIVCHNFGLGDANEEVSFSMELNRTGGNHVVDGPEDRSHVTIGTISVKTLDSLNLNPNFIKMDVEGYEANIIKGATNTIRKNKPAMVFSAYHHPYDKTVLPELIKSIRPDYAIRLHETSELDLICT